MVELPRRARALEDPAVRTQRAAVADRAPHVRPLNGLVDEIGADLGVANLSYVDPLYGGIQAELLMILTAPKADADPGRRGRRFLSADNNDPTATGRVTMTSGDLAGRTFPDLDSAVVAIIDRVATGSIPPRDTAGAWTVDDGTGRSLLQYVREQQTDA